MACRHIAFYAVTFLLLAWTLAAPAEDKKQQVEIEKEDLNTPEKEDLKVAATHWGGHLGGYGGHFGGYGGYSGYGGYGGYGGYPYYGSYYGWPSYGGGYGYGWGWPYGGYYGHHGYYW